MLFQPSIWIHLFLKTSKLETINKQLQPKVVYRRLYTWLKIQQKNTKHSIWMFPKNSGTPKSSILIGFSILNHPFWGTPIFGNTHIGKSWVPCCRLNFSELHISQPHQTRRGSANVRDYQRLAKHLIIHFNDWTNTQSKESTDQLVEPINQSINEASNQYIEAEQTQISHPITSTSISITLGSIHNASTDDVIA